MITAPKLTITEVDCCERSVTLRLPFCYGMVTLLTAPQAFIRVRIRTEDGRETWGQAAEVMAPKWFDKSPDLSNEANFDQLRRTLALYGEALSVNGAQTAFGHYASLYKAHIDAAGLEGLNPLVAGFGPALLDRAV
ncbi:MAG: mandelate racemase, partial [Alphaproteobacteria bacterium]|nr:mandelate racemase [Alphaproteobacteria bacterium]